MFKALKDVLPGMIDELGISEPLMRSAVFAAWRTIAAGLPAHARDARPLRFQQGTLTIQTPSSAAVHELHMRVPQLTRELNTKLGRPLVTKLELRVRGQRTPTRSPTGIQLPPSQKASPQATATVDDADRERRLRQAIDLIENPAVSPASPRSFDWRRSARVGPLRPVRRPRQHPRPLPALPSARGSGKRRVRRVRRPRGDAGGMNTQNLSPGASSRYPARRTQLDGKHVHGR